jgi:uncharacterized CHY-type Zn-finger protein
MSLFHAHRHTGWGTLGAVVTCERPGCKENGTHTVEIAFPEGPRETWSVCYPHEQDLKLQAIRSRQPKPRDARPEPQATVLCGACERVLDERSDIDAEARQPCPNCGSRGRRFEFAMSDPLTLHDSVQVRSKVAGKGGWMVDTKSGDDYTRDLEAWGKRTLTKDRARDVYLEVIELYDGTAVSSTASLRDHHLPC